MSLVLKNDIDLSKNYSTLSVVEVTWLTQLYDNNQNLGPEEIKKFCIETQIDEQLVNCYFIILGF